MCVHTRHCCKFHGCKYGDDDCPVALALKQQKYPCEYCHEYGFAWDLKTRDMFMIYEDDNENSPV